MKTTMKRYGLMILGIGLFAGFLFTACRKEKDEPTKGTGAGYMQVKMTDAPADYMHVYVDIQGVQVLRGDDSTSEPVWVTLLTRDTIYDLLALQDSTVIIADSTLLLFTGRVGQLRLILGPNNSVVLNDSTSYPLTIPSSQTSGLKINLNTTIDPNRTTKVTIDFDAGKSVFVTGNGTYMMKPVINVKNIEKL